MSIGTMEQGASNEDKISIGSPADSRSSSSHTLSQDMDQQQSVVNEADNVSQKKSNKKSRQDSNEERSGSNLSPQSLDDEGTSSGGAECVGGKIKRSNGSSSIENRLNDYPNSDNDNKDGQFIWTPYAEVHLLNALKGMRPVGANFDFQMNVIHARFEAGMGTYISREELLKKLYTWYNFDAALNVGGGEDIPTNQCEFSLPEDEFPEYATLFRQYKKSLEKSKSNDSGGTGK